LKIEKKHNSLPGKIISEPSEITVSAFRNYLQEA
jgi:hypothetical protein